MANSAYAQYCYLRGSVKIRNAILHRIKERKITQASIAKTVEIPPQRLNNYLKGEHKAISQHKLFAIAKELGIEIDINVKFI
jgi:predicted XRE-type DNA-binding protein